MKPILIPVLIPLAYIAFVNHDKIMDGYRAAYPADPMKRAAIEHCALSPSFSRLDPDEREACYATAGLWPEAAALAQRTALYYPDGPSHLPAGDVRREEANNTYRMAIATQAALMSAAEQPTAPRGEPTILKAR